MGKGALGSGLILPMEFLRLRLWGTGFFTLAQEDSAPRFALDPLVVTYTSP